MEEEYLNQGQWEVVEQSTGSVLFSCQFEQSEEAYSVASFYEQNGLHVEVRSPKITQTLANALGVLEHDNNTYHQSVEEEITSH
jgi:hypothetical protein